MQMQPVDAGTFGWTGRRVLLAGGLGFIGSNLARRLDALGADVLVADAMLPGGGANRRNLDGGSPRVRVVEADLRDPALSPALVDGRDVVFNLFAQTSHVASIEDPLADLSINAQAQLNLLEACRRHAPRASIVYTGTRQVYGVPRRLPVDESHPIDPVDVNGLHKFAAEGYHLVYHRVHGLATCVLRLTNTYGPRMRIRDARQTFVGTWIRGVLAGDGFEVWGGTQLRDLAYVDDVVDALLRAADPAHAGRVFNVGGSPPVTLRALADTLVRVAGRGAYRVVDYPASRRAIDIGHYHADDRRFREATGWAPRTGLDEGLARTLDYFREHFEHYA
ncbi:MAG: NAD-dependent epimerase/dehydratase family protein [Burkholderiaceae bacterium]|nr:NAD-dependent epimerase/dehydratase family protein [Burkholderiaceae bacterium]